MSTSGSTASFACDACGRSFRWSAGIAGKKAKCGCGKTLVVPTSPTLAESSAEASGQRTEPESGLESDRSDAFDIVEPAAVAPATARAAVPVAALPIEAPRPVGRGNSGGKSAGKSVAALAYQKAKTERDRERDLNSSVWGAPAERRVPLAMLAVSGLIVLGSILHDHGSPTAITVYSVVIVLKLAIMVVAAAATASFADISFGVLGLAVMRFAAIFLTYDAIVGASGWVPMAGFVFIGYMLGLLFYLLAMWKFFEMTMKEIFILYIITLALQWILSAALFAVAVALL